MTSGPSGSERRIGRAGGSSLGPYPALAIIGAIPVLVLTVFAYLVSARAVETLVRRGNEAAALITSTMVEREFEHWVATLTSHAGFPTFSAAVASGDVAAVRRRLEIFVSAHSRLDRAFVTDTTGLLWADFPVAPESLDRRFAHRDWFRGVSEAEGPYISEVYRRNADPQIQVVAVAGPVRSPTTGDVAGYLVAQVRLDGLSDLLERVEVGEEGIVLLRDHTGSLAAHPTLDLRLRRFDEYADVLPPDAAAEAEPTRGRYDDPFTEQTVLGSAYRTRVGEHTWTVISQQPIEVAFAPVRGLALRLGGAGLIMVVLMGVLLWGITQENARRRAAEAELVAMNEELEKRVEERTRALATKEDELLQARKMEAVGQLAGGVAHDFNNLLTVILSATDVLLSRFPEGTPERREVEQVRRAAARAADLTRQLLAFSRKQVIQPRVLDVNESIEKMRELLERLLGEDIDMVWELSPDLHRVKFDPGQVEQVLMNLAVNARDAMPDGGTLTIRTDNVELEGGHEDASGDARSGPHVVLAVTDTGMGMDARTREKIFEPFYTTKQLGRGTGLGLSTVYGIVRQSGGEVRVRSQPGEGSTFEIYLPATDEAASAPRERSRRVSSACTGTILVAEDEPGVRTLLVRVLGDAGYEVLEAEDAGAAERAFQEWQATVDLLLTDVVLPDRSGPELAAALEKRQAGLRVLYISGYTGDEIVRHGVLEEGIAFLEKPFDPRTLLEKVRETLDHPPFP